MNFVPLTLYEVTMPDVLVLRQRFPVDTHSQYFQVVFYQIHLHTKSWVSIHIERLDSLAKALITIVVGEKFKKIWSKTRPFFEKYADKVNADLIVLEDASFVPSAHWLKFSIYEFLKKKYDRVAFIDADILIRDDAPDLFEVVPEDEFGIFNEGQYVPRAMCLYEVMQVYGIELKRWNRLDYFNTGIMVLSREHRHIFRPPEEWKPIRNSYGEQTFINYRLFDSEVNIFSLPYRFNSMSLMNRLTGMTRLDSYFIHYAGWERDVFKDIDRDIEKWSTGKYEYKRNLFMFTGGGIGDQVCAEPVLRYIKEFLYPEADVYVLAAEPRIFKHLDIKASNSYPKDENGEVLQLDAVHEMNAHPSRLDNLHLQAQHLFTHGVDYISLASLGRIIPDEDKSIKLTYSKEEMQEVLDICPEPEKLTVVHPGVGWQSKTFPTKWWQKIVDGIDKVGIIGKKYIEGHAYAPVKTPRKGVDFRDKLSLGGLIALLSKARILVSNDSGPIHIAGAWDNDIVLIPSCKHPDLLLPYRHGTKSYKTHAVYKSIMHDVVRPGDLPTDLVPWMAKDWLEMKLPKPKEVLSVIKAI